jgi:hypothetical protein
LYDEAEKVILRTITHEAIIKMYLTEEEAKSVSDESETELVKCELGY